jgi:hypothetical protein
MNFLKRLNPTFERRSMMLLDNARISSLDEPITVMLSEESHMKLHLKVKGDVGMHSTLVISNSSMIGV